MKTDCDVDICLSLNSAHNEDRTQNNYVHFGMLTEILGIIEPDFASIEEEVF